MKLAYLRWVAPAIICITLAGPAFGAASLPTTRPAPAATTTPASTPAPAPTASTSLATAGDVSSYAERERAAQNLENFRGGATLVIGGSVLVLALLIVLILLLV